MTSLQNPQSKSPPLVTSLPPIPHLEFFPDIHRYRFQGNWINHSITTVVSDKTPAQMKRIMSTRSEWEPRGNTVHACLENFLLHGDPGDPGAYDEWVGPLTAHPIWNTWEPVAVEGRLVDPRHSIAGSFDAVLRHKDNGNLVIADLKTQSSEHSKPRDISPQLGGYLNLIDINYPEVAGRINRGIAIWARPGSTAITTFEAADCIDNYLAARSLFLSKQPVWDF